MAKNDIVRHQFAKGYDPKRNSHGAPRKLFSTLSELGYSKRQVADTMLNILALTKSEVKGISEDEGCTLLERSIAKALLKDYSKGSLWNVEVLLSRAIGKPKETATIETETQKQIVVVYGEAQK